MCMEVKIYYVKNQGTKEFMVRRVSRSCFILTTFVCIPISCVEIEKKIICFVSWSLFNRVHGIPICLQNWLKCGYAWAIGQVVGICNDIAERRAVCDLKAFHSKMQKKFVSSVLANGAFLLSSKGLCLVSIYLLMMVFNPWPADAMCWACCKLWAFWELEFPLCLLDLHIHYFLSSPMFLVRYAAAIYYPTVSSLVMNGCMYA